MAQPGVRQKALEPDVLRRGADGGKAETEDDSDRPGTKRAPLDAAAIPIGAARADVEQVFGAVVVTVNQVDHEDPDPGSDRHCQQGNEGDERAVETVGDQHEVDRAGEDRDDIHHHRVDPFDLEAQGQRGQAGGVHRQVVRQQQTAERGDQVRHGHPRRQHVADRHDRVSRRRQIIVAHRQQAAESDQQHQRNARAERRRRHQAHSLDAAMLIARHVSTGVGPTDTGASGHGADADDHCAQRCWRGVEYRAPVDGRAEKTTDENVQRAEHVRRPLLDHQQGRVAEAGHRQGQQDEDGDKDQRQ